MIYTKPRASFSFRFIEVVLTLLGLVTVITPLILWSVPQHHDFSVLVFYFVLSVGGGSILAFIALARLQSLLNPDDMGAGKVKDLKDLRQRLAHWEQQQDEDRRAAMPPTVFKKNALGEFRYMLGIAALLALAFGIIFFAGWTIIDVRYG